MEWIICVGLGWIISIILWPLARWWIDRPDPVTQLLDVVSESWQAALGTLSDKDREP